MVRKFSQLLNLLGATVPQEDDHHHHLTHQSQPRYGHSRQSSAGGSNFRAINMAASSSSSPWPFSRTPHSPLHNNNIHTNNTNSNHQMLNRPSELQLTSLLINIQQLPDEIIITILQFLSVQELSGTIALVCKRFSLLWLHAVKNLDVIGPLRKLDEQSFVQVIRNFCRLESLDCCNLPGAGGFHLTDRGLQALAHKYIYREADALSYSSSGDYDDFFLELSPADLRDLTAGLADEEIEELMNTVTTTTTTTTTASDTASQSATTETEESELSVMSLLEGEVDDVEETNDNRGSLTTLDTAAPSANTSYGGRVRAIVARWPPAGTHASRPPNLLDLPFVHGSGSGSNGGDIPGVSAAPQTAPTYRNSIGICLTATTTTSNATTTTYRLSVPAGFSPQKQAPTPIPRLSSATRDTPTPARDFGDEKSRLDFSDKRKLVEDTIQDPANSIIFIHPHVILQQHQQTLTATPSQTRSSLHSPPPYHRRSRHTTAAQKVLDNETIERPNACNNLIVLPNERFLQQRKYQQQKAKSRRSKSKRAHKDHDKKVSSQSADCSTDGEQQQCGIRTFNIIKRFQQQMISKGAAGLPFRNISDYKDIQALIRLRRDSLIASVARAGASSVSSATPARTRNANAQPVPKFGLPTLQRLNLSGCSITSKGVYYTVYFGKDLRVLNLKGCHKIDDEAMTHICEFWQLESLNLTGTRVTDAGLQILSNTKSKRLSTLDLVFLIHITDTGLKHLSKISSLEHIDVTACRQVTGEGLACLFRSCKVVSLNLTGCDRVTLVNVFSENNSSGCEPSPSVETGASETNTTDVLRDTLPNQEFCYPSLTKIVMMGCKAVTDACLCSLACCTRLEDLTITYSSCVTDEGVKAITDGCWRCLKVLNLKRCKQISDISLQHISSKCSNLTSLDVSSCRSITNASFGALSALHNLKELHLQKTLIDATGILYIALMIHLQVVDLGECQQLTTTDVLPLCEALNQSTAAGRHIPPFPTPPASQPSRPTKVLRVGKCPDIDVQHLRRKFVCIEILETLNEGCVEVFA